MGGCRKVYMRLGAIWKSVGRYSRDLTAEKSRGASMTWEGVEKSREASMTVEGCRKVQGRLDDRGRV